MTLICRPLPSLPPIPGRCSPQESLKQAVGTAVARARLADTQDLPAIVHQLLALAARGPRELVLTVRGQQGAG